MRKVVAFKIRLFLLVEELIKETQLRECGLILLSSHTWLWAKKAKGESVVGDAHRLRKGGVRQRISPSKAAPFRALEKMYNDDARLELAPFG